jgi:hypothetical protein
MSEIQALQKFLAEKDAELERLKAEIRKVETLWFSEHYRIKELLARAADALDRGPLFSQPLVDELRKAAQ